MNSFAEMVANKTLDLGILNASIYKKISNHEVKGYCAFYNTILDDASKERIRNYFKNDPELGIHFPKYEMMTKLCKSETMDSSQFIAEYKEFIESLGFSVSDLKTQANANIEHIIAMIQQQKYSLLREFETMKLMPTGIPVAPKNPLIRGGTKRKRRKTIRRKSRLL